MISKQWLSKCWNYMNWKSALCSHAWFKKQVLLILLSFYVCLPCKIGSSYRAVVPSLFGNRDEFFHGSGGGGKHTQDVELRQGWGRRWRSGPCCRLKPCHFIFVGDKINNVEKSTNACWTHKKTVDSTTFRD